MSDNPDDIAKRFKENVLRDRHPTKFGLFPIPEYPELEADQGMWSAALDAILTTLRYLAPATLLTLFWGQQSFIFKLLKGIDSAFRAIVYSSEEQKQEVLQWLAEAGPVRVEHLDTVWRHGWILCGVLDSALPGACAGHAPTRLSLKHAQTIADHYLGVEPVFSRQELESNEGLSRHQEWKLATYIDRIRKALSKLPPAVSKPTSQRTSPETQMTFDYVARGSGLAAAQVNNKMRFKVYPTSHQSMEPGEINILIRGPKDTYGMTVVPPIFGKAQIIRQKLLGLQEKPVYTETALPLTQGTTYMRTFGKNDMNKTYYIPKATYDIDIEVDLKEDHAVIHYTVMLEGKYEISITSRGQNILGSPFSMVSSKNILSTLEKESFCLEDGEEINIVDVKSDRKVILRIVDFVTEKMLLRENGTFEKITDDEANILMSMDYTPSGTPNVESRTCSEASTRSDDFNKLEKFSKAASKVVQMNRVCKIINNLLAEKRKREKAFTRPKSHQSIPDIVNSTFSEVNVNPFLLQEKRDKVIIPENISVSLKTEKAKAYNEELQDKIQGISIEIDTPDSLEKYEDLIEPTDGCMTDMTDPTRNPFLNHNYEQIEKDLGSFVKTEYETNKSENEVTEGEQIKILVETVDDSHTLSPIKIKNPFVEPDIVFMERPKTPVLKIISGEVKDREDSLFVNPNLEEQFSDEMLANEFLNPFFLHHHKRNEELPVTDFIIGAPVSLPPIIRSSTPEPNMNSIIITDEIPCESKENYEVADDQLSSVFSTPLHTNLNKLKETKNVDNNLAGLFHSLDSNATDNVEILSLSDTVVGNRSEPYRQSRLERDVHSKKDTWDSAYVSIDDSNSSPDNNNNDNNPLCENLCKQKFSFTDIEYEYPKMGPAEREIWESCNEIKESKFYEEPKPKWETKRPTFTPILEESDRSISTGMKDAIKSDSASHTVTFSELNDSRLNLSAMKNNNALATNIEKMNYTTKINDKSVDSASAPSDVKRHAENSEGKISEVQANVTESGSVSQTLHKFEKKHLNYSGQSQHEIQFGDENKSNIVLVKKQYWDERIREIQAKSTEEDKTQQKRRRLSARHLRQNDSLTKRRGKQIVKNFLNADGQSVTRDNTDSKTVEIVNRKSPLPHHSPDKVSDVKLVEKWKNYWDNKLQSDKEESESSCFRAKSPKSRDSTPTQLQYSNDDLIEQYQEPYSSKTECSKVPVKQELSEEVFRAFETSPKRFFGTSRKQILNKIDTFLGKPGIADVSSPDHSDAVEEYDSGLVSSRISLFHTISKTEELPWVRRKCQSMHNIFQRKDSERSIPSVKEDEEDSITKETNIKIAVPKNTGLERKYVTIDSEEVRRDPEKAFDNVCLKDKRSRLVQNIHNKSFDASSYSKWPQTDNAVGMHTSNVKKTINEYNKHSDHRKRYTTNVLRKSSVSKSEMDIFNKISTKPVEDDLDKYKSCDELPKINVKSFINLYESVSKDVKPQRPLSKTKEMGLQRSSHSSLPSGATNKIHNTRKFNKPTSETDESITDLAQSPTPQSKTWNKEPDSFSSGSYEPRSLDSVDVDIIQLKDLPKNTTYVSLSDIELEIIENVDKSNETLQPKEATEANTEDYKCRFKMAKEFFQSLEDVSEIKKSKKLNECERLLLSESSESLEQEKEPVRPPRRVKKNIKSHSMPSSEISKIWNQLQYSNTDPNKLVKISEKFNVDDLFNDVMEGKFSRQGSLRGIPHKKAVLEAFRSMENLTDKNISSYEIAATQLTDFAKENQIRNAQTYLTEYPFLPTTDPSKYHSRLDAKATGLISLKELQNQKPRRNSVPDLRLNPSFTVKL